MKPFMACLAFLAMCLCFSGCYITQNPFADINKQGIVIKLGESVTIQSTNGPVTIEYVSPTERRIIWNGESREFSLLKGAYHMGVFAETKFPHGPIKNVYGVNYGEGTIAFRTKSELQKYLTDVEKFGFEHRADAQMIVHCDVYEYTSVFLKKRKWLYIGVEKYQILNPKEAKPLWGYLYPVPSE
jgi:hypothetical protein